MKEEKSSEKKKEKELNVGKVMGVLGGFLSSGSHSLVLLLHIKETYFFVLVYFDALILDV